MRTNSLSDPMLMDRFGAIVIKRSGEAATFAAVLLRALPATGCNGR
jgi:hypothetical protein